MEGVESAIRKELTMVGVTRPISGFRQPPMLQTRFLGSIDKKDVLW